MTKTKQRKLKQSEVIKLSKWIESRKESLESEPTTIADLASKASTDLGFSIAGSSIRPVAEAVEVELATKPKGGGISGFSKDELASMRRRIANVEQAVCDLAEQVKQLDSSIYWKGSTTEERLKQPGASAEFFPASS